MSEPNSSNHRILYTRDRSTKKRRRQNVSTQRFHGAFTGGFSAGHFNTVGSKKGWKPSDEGADEEETEFDGYNLNNHNDVGDEDDYYRPKSKPVSKAKMGSKAASGLSFKTKAASSLSRMGIKQQRVEDFMDEEDANEWGGPSSIRAGYMHDFDSRSKNDDDGGNREGTDGKGSNDAKIRALLSDNKQTLRSNDSISIGKQLLRVLGWRESIDDDSGGISYAYVPLNEGETIDEKDGNGNCQDALLTNKRLKRIVLKINKSFSSSSKHHSSVPPPKFDTYGLGFEPFQNAPEFRAHREMRKKRAEMRAIAAASTHGDGRMNVYRTSALSDLYGLDEEGDDGYGMARRRGRGPDHERDQGKEATAKGGVGREDGRNSHGDVLAYETNEDFIGSKTVAGFALHDDADDVYDDGLTDGNGMMIGNGGNGKTESRIDKGEYQNEIYEASDSEEEGNRGVSAFDEKEGTKDSGIDAFAGALSAWATGSPTAKSDGACVQKKEKKTAVTSDGKMPLQGFILGSEANAISATKRYPGPTPPPNYEVKKHVFPQMDTLDKMKQLSSQMKGRLKSQRRVGSHGNNGARSNDVNGKSDSRQYLKQGRSFAALSDSLKDRFTTATTKGNDEIKTRSSAPSDPTKVTIARRTMSWQPTLLLCKRLGVSVPRVTNAGSHMPNTSSSTKAYVAESREESFFKNEVLGRLDPSSKTTAQKAQNPVLTGENIEIERPAMELMKSIFEPVSDDDYDSELFPDSDEECTVENNGNNKVIGKNVAPSVDDDHEHIKSQKIESALEEVVPDASSQNVFEANEDSTLRRRKDRKESRRRRRSKTYSDHDVSKYYSTHGDEPSGVEADVKEGKRNNRKERKHKRRSSTNSCSEDESRHSNLSGQRRHKKRHRKERRHERDRRRKPH